MKLRLLAVLFSFGLIGNLSAMDDEEVKEVIAVKTIAALYENVTGAINNIGEITAIKDGNLERALVITRLALEPFVERAQALEAQVPALTDNVENATKALGDIQSTLNVCGNGAVVAAVVGNVVYLGYHYKNGSLWPQGDEKWHKKLWQVTKEKAPAIALTVGAVAFKLLCSKASSQAAAGSPK